MSKEILLIVALCLTALHVHAQVIGINVYINTANTVAGFWYLCPPTPNDVECPEELVARGTSSTTPPGPCGDSFYPPTGTQTWHHNPLCQSPHIFLTRGVEYAFRVRAVNNFGWYLKKAAVNSKTEGNIDATDGLTSAAAGGINSIIRYRPLVGETRPIYACMEAVPASSTSAPCLQFTFVDPVVSSTAVSSSSSTAPSSTAESSSSSALSSSSTAASSSTGVSSSLSSSSSGVALSSSSSTGVVPSSTYSSSSTGPYVAPLGGKWVVLTPDFQNYQFVDKFIVMEKTSANPTVYLVRGYKYIFDLGASGHPFWIKTIPGTNALNAIPSGPTENLDYNGFDVATVTFTVPLNYTYNTLYYNCEYHANMKGVFYIVDTPAQASASTLMSSVFIVISLIVLLMFI